MSRTKLVIGPAVEPVTLADLKQHLRVSITDDDAYITSLGIMARRVLERKISCSLINQTWDMILDCWPSNWLPRNGGVLESMYLPPSTRQKIRILNPPLSSVVSITYVDPNGISQVLDPGRYRVLDGIPGEVVPAYNQPWPVVRTDLETITMRYVAGFSADASLVPVPFLHWIKLAVGSAYENREEVITLGTASRLGLAAELLAAEDPGIYQ